VGAALALKFHSVGRDVEPKLGRAKVTGAGRYVADMSLPNMLHTAVLRSEVPYARIRSLDISRSLAAPGVQVVLGRAELGLDDRLRQVGDVIAAIAAESEEEARAALQEIDVELDELPPLLDPLEALVSDTVLYDEFPGNVAFKLERTFGDPDSAFEASDLVLEETYRTGRPVHCNLSRHCCIARVDNDGQLVLMSSVDGPHYARRHLARLLRVDEGTIRIVVPELLSSSFGGHSTINPLHEPIAARLAQWSGGRPVRFLYSSEDEFLAIHTRHPVTVRIKAGCGSDGELLALELDLLADHGSFPNEIARVVCANTCDRVGELLSVPNYRYKGVNVLTNNINAGEFRGIGSTQLMYVLGSHLDEMARHLGIDQIEFYRRNAVKCGDRVLTTGVTLGSCGLEECMEQGAEAIGWNDPSRRIPTRSGRRRGIGMGVGIHTTGLGHEGGDPSRASLNWYGDGSVDLMIGAPDSGQGASTIYAQIVAEELPVGYGDVRIAPIDTATSPLDPWGTVASRGVYVVGTAVREAARDARRALFELASEELGVSVDSLSLTDDGLLRWGETESLEVSRFLSRMGGTAGHGWVNSRVHPPTYGAYFADVEVDEQTGQVFVLRVAAALDLGFAMNPQQCRGQIQGAVVMGQELALSASLELEDGVPLNGSFLDYRVGRMDETPEITAILVETSSEPTSPYGAKGIGTPSLVPVAPAIANAVRDAIGVRIRQVPITPEVVHRALASADAASSASP
jgi:CO/xanthine dehydrogenase Mo-binding subunit